VQLNAPLDLEGFVS